MGIDSSAGNTAPRLIEGVHIMARMGYAVGHTSPAAVVVALALAPLEDDADDAWSIDREPMGSGWHDSSWMLKKGLDVIEGVPPESIPPEWRWRWWVSAAA